MKQLSISLVLLASIFSFGQVEEDSLWVAFSFECDQRNENECVRLGNELEQRLSVQYGDTSKRYLNGLLRISTLFTQNTYLSSAESILQAHKTKVGSKYGTSSLEYARALSMLGRCNVDQGNHRQAKSLYFEALGIREIKLGNQHELYANSLNNIGILYRDLAVYDSALYFFSEAERIFSLLPDKNGHLLANVYNNIGNACADLGNKERASQAYQKALEWIQKNYGSVHSEYAMTLSNLGNLWYDMGQMKEAEKCYMEASAIFLQTVGEDHLYFINLQNNLGSFYAGIGDYVTAESYYLKSLSSIEKMLGTNHPDYAMGLNNLAILYGETKQFDKAHRMQRQTLSTIQRVFGDKHMYTLSYVHNLGFIFSQENKLDSALYYYKRSLSICMELYGEEHNEFGVLLNNIAQTYESLDSLQLSEEYYLKALSVYSNVLGKNHPDYINCEMDYALLLIRKNRFNEAVSKLKELLNVHSKYIAANFEWLSDQQKEGYWKKENQLYSHLAALTVKYHQDAPELAGFAYDQALSAKGRLLEAKISQEEYLNALDVTMQEARDKSRELNRLISEGIADKKAVTDLTIQVDSLSKQLTVSWPAYAEKQREMLVSFRDIQRVLEPHELAIEFVRYPLDLDSGFAYFALLLSKKEMFPTVIPLCYEKDLQALDPRFDLDKYYELLWKPLESKLNEFKKIYYTPDGFLWQVPFHALYDGSKTSTIPVAKSDKNRGVLPAESRENLVFNAKYVMDEYMLIPMNSSRYLAFDGKNKLNMPIEKSAFFMGGIDYDFLPADSKKARSKRTKIKPLKVPSAFVYLPGTYTEVTTIADQLIKSDWKVELMLSTSATEDAFLSKDFQHTEIVHLATHGFTIPLGAHRLPLTDNPGSFVDHIRFHPNPMVRSGFILSGGNWTWKGLDTLKKLGLKENGIVTALEVATLNLRKTRLVVLSACETGLGEQQDTEGVLGLRRAFKLAGVQEMIISLWEVPDKETMELMQYFYEFLNELKVPMLAFMKAQGEMKNNYPEKPYVWAGFLFTL